MPKTTTRVSFHAETTNGEMKVPMRPAGVELRDSYVGELWVSYPDSDPKSRKNGVYVIESSQLAPRSQRQQQIRAKLLDRNAKMRLSTTG
jgi:hypothetical protein